MMRFGIGMLIMIMMFLSGVTDFVWAHGQAHGQAAGLEVEGAWWSSWTWSWSIISCFVLVTLSYVYGWKKQLQRFPKKQKDSWVRMKFFCLAILFLVVALLGPLDAYSEQLSWVHMLQHTCLMMVAAPLLALSSPGYMSQWSFPAKFWRRFWVWKNRGKQWGFAIWEKPLLIAGLYGLTLWLWHLPFLYERALHNELVHDLQHISFFLSAYWFWWLLLDPYVKRPLREEVGILYVFASSLHAMILGVLMALSPTVWYQSYLKTSPQYGLTALQDQNLAGLIMWMPAGTTYLVVAVFLFLRIINGTSKVIRVSESK